MDELSSTVSLANPKSPSDDQKFTFDTILWSFDGYSEQADGYLSPDNKLVSEETYCDQVMKNSRIYKVHHLIECAMNAFALLTKYILDAYD